MPWNEPEVGLPLMTRYRDRPLLASRIKTKFPVGSIIHWPIVKVLGEVGVGALPGGGTVGIAVDLIPWEYTLPSGGAINVMPVICKVDSGTVIFFSFGGEVIVATNCYLLMRGSGVKTTIAMRLFRTQI